MSPHLIRMWERRYSAVEPSRTATGRRLYSDDDIERLMLLRKATQQGESIGQIASLPVQELRALAQPEETKSENGLAGESSIEQHLELCLNTMKDLNANALETRLLRASISLGRQSFLDKVLHPMLERTGEMWADGRLKVAHEHLASAVIRSLLGSIYAPNSADPSAPLLISTTPQGQHHEFGSLMASVTAAGVGWRTLYLGSSLPAEDIVEAVREREADALALSIVYPPDDPHLPAELLKIRRLLDDRTPLLAGGRAAINYGRTLDEIGAVRMSGLVDLRRELTRLQQSISVLSASGMRQKG